MTPALELRDAFLLYPSSSGATVALQGLDLAIEPGEIVVALGPSGAGKSTLLRVLAGLERLSAGSARVFDADLNQLGRSAVAAFRSTYIGLLDQHYARSLSADLSCRHNVALQLELLGVAPEPSHRRAEELLEHVGLLDRAGSRPGTLSGGEQQRVALCAAIAHNPRLLLADEPAGELDVKNADTAYRLLGELVRGAQATALIVSHDQAAASIADRLVYIRDGRIAEQARPGHTPTLVISRKGWARLPRHHPDQDGVAGDAHASVEDGRIVLTPDPTRTEPAPGAPATIDPATTTSTARAGIRTHGIGVELRDVSKRYGTPTGDHLVLDGVTWDFPAGGLTGLVGRSGSGKTTLIHLIAGLDRPTGGTITIGGHDLNGKTRTELAELRRREIALVTQEPGLIPYLTALENVQLGIRLRSDDTHSATRALDALLQVGLADRTGHRASELSAGERERVAIARAIAANVSVLLVDEPTARLDEENARAIGTLLATAAHRHGLTVICATHDPALIRLVDDTIHLDRAFGALADQIGPKAAGPP
jgi:ABC-type lipoprotein export system ATPase subunit